VFSLSHGEECSENWVDINNCILQTAAVNQRRQQPSVGIDLKRTGGRGSEIEMFEILPRD